MAGLGVSVALFTLAFFGFNFLTYGTTAEVARLRGAGRDREAATYALQALWLAVRLGVAVTVVFGLAAPLLRGAVGGGCGPAAFRRPAGPPRPHGRPTPPRGSAPAGPRPRGPWRCSAR